MLNDSFIERTGVQIFEGFPSIAEAMSYLALRDVRVMEINLNNPYFLAQISSEKDRKEIVNVVTGEGITWVAHLPESIGFFTVEEEVFARYLMWLVRIQTEANDTGCRALTIHLGDAPYFAFSGQKRLGTDLFREYYETTLLMRLTRAANLLRKGPPVSIENVGGFHHQFVRDILNKVEGLSYTMDIGHLKTVNPKTAEAEFGFFMEHRDEIRVVHVHDNAGDFDAHEVVTDQADIEPYFSFAKDTDAYLVMEIRPLEAAFSSLAALTGIKR
ncbi:hypothetical protein GX441_09435 [bacterium]|nr:hypothetical protein [bacterium]